MNFFKLALIAGSFVVASNFVMANDAHKAAPKMASNKVTRKEARKQCLAENASLTGKDLKDCVKNKISR